MSLSTVLTTYALGQTGAHACGHMSLARMRHHPPERLSIMRQLRCRGHQATCNIASKYARSHSMRRAVRVSEFRTSSHYSITARASSLSRKACVLAVQRSICTALRHLAEHTQDSGPGPGPSICSAVDIRQPRPLIPIRIASRLSARSCSSVHHVDVRREHQDQRPESSLRPGQTTFQQRNEALATRLPLPCRCRLDGATDHLPAHLLMPQAMADRRHFADRAGLPISQAPGLSTPGAPGAGLPGPWPGARRPLQCCAYSHQQRESDCAACWRRIHLNGLCDLGWSPSCQRFLTLKAVHADW
jgi:hypothetical protein